MGKTDLDEEMDRILSLRQETDFVRYINLIAGLKNSIVVFAAKDTVGFSVKPDGYDALRSVGLSKLDSQGKMSNHWKGYAAIIENGEVLFEEIGQVHEPILFKGEVNGTSLDIVSAPLHGGNTASVWVNGKEYCVDKRGLNIVVISAGGDVRDSVAFDTHLPQRKCTRIDGCMEGLAILPHSKENLFNRNLKDSIKRLDMDCITRGWKGTGIESPKIKVRLFFYGWYILWTAVETLVEAFEEDPTYDVLVIMESTHKKTLEIISSGGRRVIFKREYNMEKDCPDIIIYNSYIYSPRKLPSTTLSVYVGAGLNDGGNESYGTREWIKSMEEKMHADLYITEKHQANSRNWHGFGNPKFDVIYRNLHKVSKIPKAWEKLKNKTVILWAPDHKWAQKDLAFDLYARPFFDYFQSDKDMGLIVRMHPSYLSELIGSRVWSEGDVRRLESYCNSLPNVVWDNRKDYGLAYSMADAVVTDINCGITISALPLDVPVAVALRYDGDVCRPNYPGLMEAIYQIHDVAEAYRFFQDVRNGKDPLREKRAAIMRDYVAHFDGENGIRIKEFIEKKYFSRCHSQSAG